MCILFLIDQNEIYIHIYIADMMQHINLRAESMEI